MISKTFAIAIILTLGGMTMDSATAEPPHKAKDKTAAQAEKHAHDKKSSKGMDDEERAALMRERHEEMHEHRAEGGENDMRGNERAQEMRARRDERKAIKEEYRASREPGQEGVGQDQRHAEGGKPEKAKKPWWKFWGE